MPTENYYTANGDGRVSAGQGDNWATARDAANGFVAEANAITGVVKILYTDESQYDIWRLYLPFNTTLLPAGTITAATISMNPTSVAAAENMNTTYLVVANQNQNNTSNLEIEDYSRVSNTAVSDQITLTSVNDAYNNFANVTFTLTAEGRNLIVPGGVSRFGVRMSHDIANVAPTVQNNTGTSCGFSMLELGSNGPVLSVTYDEAGADYIKLRWTK